MYHDRDIEKARRIRKESWKRQYPKIKEKREALKRTDPDAFRKRYESWSGPHRVKEWAAYCCRNARTNSRRYEGRAHELTKEFVLELYAKQNGLCYWLGIPLVPSPKRHPQAPSLDRVDCSKGYTPDNVVLACQFANMGRSNCPAGEFAAFVSGVRDVLKAA